MTMMMMDVDDARGQGVSSKDDDIVAQRTNW